MVEKAAADAGGLEALAAGAATDDPVSIQMDKRIDLVLSLAVVATGAGICYLASQFRAGSFPDPITSRGLPYFAGGFMILAGLINAARRVMLWPSIPGRYTVSEGSDDEAGQPASALRTFSIVALAFVWVWLVPDVGYLLLTPPMLFAMLWAMEVRSPVKLIAFPLGFTLIIWSVFSQVLGVILPLGPLTATFRAWGLTP